jgi:hypothetical protein
VSRAATPFRQVRGESCTPKALCDAGSEFADILRSFMYGISQDVPYLVLHASRVPFGAPLELLCDVVVEVSNDKLCHARYLRADDITISHNRVACITPGDNNEIHRRIRQRHIWPSARRRRFLARR